MVAKSAGMTLIEIAITMTIVAMLLLAAIPFTLVWARTARVNEAKTILQQGYDLSKALALRNSAGATAQTAAAGMKLAGATLIVCTGDPTNATTCTVGAGGSVKWQTTLPVNTTATFGSGQTLGLDNTGMPLPLSTTLFNISNGGQNDSGDFTKPYKVH